jgi:hypothetical protein
MATLTKFFWKNSVEAKDTYLYGLVSVSNALEMGRALQTVSSATLYQFEFSPSGVCLPGGTGRRYEYEIKPNTEKPTLTAYKRPGDGAGMGVFFVVYLTGGTRRIALTAPSPRVALLNDAHAAKIIAEELCRAFRNAAKISTLSVSSLCIIAPKHYQKAFDGLVWYPKK